MTPITVAVASWPAASAEGTAAPPETASRMAPVGTIMAKP